MTMTEQPIFTLTVEETYREGYGVVVDAIYSDHDQISEIEVQVVAIAEDLAELLGGTWCVPAANQGDGGIWCPISLFQVAEELDADDTHDFRPRLFATEEEANSHADYTRRRWANPAPWESFITFT